MKPVVVFAISGHGFGHASRQTEIMRALHRQRPDVAIDIRTSAPRWLFERALDFPFSFESVEVDTGIEQVDSLEVDVGASIARAAAFHRTLDDRIDAEARALTTRGADLVVGDIPPLACAAAARAGIPAIAVGNFTWDWIYAGYPETPALAPDLVPTLGRAYSGAAAAWRLPLHGGFGAFETIVDIPLVARRSTRNPVDVRRQLGFPRNRTLALFAFGRYGIGGVNWPEVARMRRCHVVFTTGPHAPPGPDGDTFTTLDEGMLAGQGIAFEDLVAAGRGRHQAGLRDDRRVRRQRHRDALHVTRPVPGVRRPRRRSARPRAGGVHRPRRPLRRPLACTSGPPACAAAP